MIAATHPGASYGEALEAGIAAYERLGYHDEWQHHFQGGPIAYAPREFNPTPSSHPGAFTDYAVAVGHCCAWNPTVRGGKSEDTFLVGPGGPELISNSDEWPALEVAVGAATVRRPALLELDAGGSGS